MPVPVEVFLSNRGLWMPIACLLMVCAALSALLTAKVAGLLGSDRTPAFAWLLSVSVILAFTLPTRMPPGGLRPLLDGPLLCAIGAPRGIAEIVDPQNLLNVLLYVPAALLGALVTGRPLRVASGLAATSVSIEIVQLLSSTRSCDTTDMLFNVLGALVGTGVGTVVLRMASSKDTVPRRSPPAEAHGRGERCDR